MGKTIRSLRRLRHQRASPHIAWRMLRLLSEQEICAETHYGLRSQADVPELKVKQTGVFATNAVAVLLIV